MRKIYLLLVLVFSMIIGSYLFIQKSSIIELILITILISYTYARALISLWNGLSSLIKKGIIIINVILLIAIILNYYLTWGILIFFVKFIVFGLFTMSVFLPLVFDNILIMISSKHSRVPNINEALVLYRNRLPDLIQDFSFGLKLAINQNIYRQRNKIKTIYLVIISFVAIIPNLGSQLLSVVFFRKFKVHNITFEDKEINRTIFWISVNLCMLFCLFIIR